MSTLRLSRRAADRLRAGHLWVYRTEIEPRGGDPLQTGPAAGDLVTLTDSRDLPLGTALYSSASTLAARLISRTAGLTRDQYLADLRTRVADAFALRRELAPITAENDAQRLIFSEADDLPGIVADRYNDLVLVQLLTQGTAQDDVRRTVTEALRAGILTDTRAGGEGAGGLTIWERPDPRIRELEQLAPPPAGPLFTTHAETPAPRTTTFTLNGLRFHYDAGSGQKTGAFLDQRLNYAAAAAAVQGLAARAGKGRARQALDFCTYQGGFALHLAQVCGQVTGIDASRSALEAADRNLQLNPQLSAGCETDWIEADAFEYLRHLDDLTRSAQPGSRAGGGAAPAQSSDAALFDAVVLDPPAFAKSKRAAEGALRGYKELNLRALRILAPGGILVTCSCSHHVSLAQFTDVVSAAAADAGRRVQLLETRAAAPDHPEVLSLPETRYLKCLICRVD